MCVIIPTSPLLQSSSQNKARDTLSRKNKKPRKTPGNALAKSQLWNAHKFRFSQRRIQFHEECVERKAYNIEETTVHRFNQRTTALLNRIATRFSSVNVPSHWECQDDYFSRTFDTNLPSPVFIYQAIVSSSSSIKCTFVFVVNVHAEANLSVFVSTRPCPAKIQIQ